MVQVQRTSGTFDYTVTPVNDEQVLVTNTGATVVEGSTGNVITTAMLETTDVDNTDGELIYTITTTPGNGILYNNGVALGVSDTFSQSDIDAGLISYSHDGAESALDGFDFTVDDGQGTGTSGTFHWAISNVNDAPINTVPGAQVVNEDTSLNITGISVNDPDGNLTTTQLTVSNGTLNVSLASGASISGGANGSNTLTLSGTQSQINAALASLSYQGDLNFNGADTLTVLSTDSDGMPLSDTDNVSITVTSVNDEQVLVTNTGATVVEGSTGNVITTAMLETTDVDNTHGELIYTITTTPGIRHLIQQRCCVGSERYV